VRNTQRRALHSGGRPGQTHPLSQSAAQQGVHHQAQRRAPSQFLCGSGRDIHHKFVVTDFNLPTAKVFTGSTNFAPSGEAGNGDQLIMIDDPTIATAYAIEGVRVFDHLRFRDRMRGAFGAKGQRLANATAPKEITLQKPTAISGADHPWFDRFYKPETQAFRDRVVFST